MSSDHTTLDDTTLALEAYDLANEITDCFALGHHLRALDLSRQHRALMHEIKDRAEKRAASTTEGTAP